MEALTITTPATDLPISVSDLKHHLRITHNLDDDYITDLAWMAYAWIEQEADITISETVYSYRLDEFNPKIVLPKPPVQSLDAFTYYDTDGTSQAFTDYYLLNSTKQAAVVVCSELPCVFNRPDAVTITFTAGSDLPPAQVLHLMRLLVSNAYEHREGEIAGTITTTLKLGVDRLISQIRNVRYV